MRVLLDECVPRPLGREPPDHRVHTIRDMGWMGKENGELLALIVKEQIDSFVTVDQNLPYQQNLQTAGVALIVLIAWTNRLEDLLPLIQRLRRTLDTIRPGQLVHLGER